MDILMLGGSIYVFGFLAAMAIGYLVGTWWLRKGLVMPIGLGFGAFALVLGPHAFRVPGGDAYATVSGSMIGCAVVMLTAGRWLRGRENVRLCVSGLGLAFAGFIALSLGKVWGLVDSDTLWWSNAFWVLSWLVLMPLCAGRVGNKWGHLLKLPSYKRHLPMDAPDPAKTSAMELLTPSSYSPGYLGISMAALALGVTVIGGWILDGTLGGCWDGDSILLVWTLPLWAVMWAYILRDVTGPAPRLAVMGGGLILWSFLTSVSTSHTAMPAGLMVFAIQLFATGIWARIAGVPWEMMAGTNAGVAGNPALGIAIAVLRGEYELLPVLAILSPIFVLGYWLLGIL